MLARKVYKKPPLVEVFADFSFNDDLPWDVLKLADFYQEIGGKTAFPQHKGPDQPSRKSLPRPKRPQHRLWQFLSEQGDRIVQVGPHQLAINQLPPYYGWENFRRDAERIIAAYLRTWSAEIVESSGLHYIDVVLLPGQQINAQDYFNLFPVFPTTLLQRPVGDLMLSCDFEGDREGETLRIFFEHVAEEPSEFLFRLQFDYLSIQAVPARPIELIVWLDRAHERASEAFRACLTPRCEALFEPE